MPRLNTYVPEEVMVALKERARATDVAQARIVRRALEAHLGLTAEPPQKAKRNPQLTKALKEEEQAAVYKPTTGEALQAKVKKGNSALPEGWYHKFDQVNCPHGMALALLEHQQCEKCNVEMQPWRKCKDPNCEQGKAGKLHPWHEVRNEETGPAKQPKEA
jgi:predicted  nucleic acid-binding Zn-ribbon protein